MERREYRTVDKSTWPRGEWNREPDKIQWADEATGMPCLIVRGPVGALCGYVGVAEGHPLFGTDYSHIEFDLDVHGGITFSDLCSPNGNEAERVCHVPGPGEPDHVWWFGFDCAHAFDYSPHLFRSVRSNPNLPEEEYRNVAYVQAECAKLAQQLAAFKKTDVREL